ncbi:MAG: nucleotidyltransferase family protein [Prevotella sp.]|nr:nucleotidyltransferase family protein [Prevotella sp.]
MTKRDFIFTLLRSALWDEKLDHFKMSPWEYKEVMTDGEKQCVLGLLTDCLRNNNMGLQKKCVIHMLKVQNALEKKNKSINAYLVELTDLFTSSGVRFAVVKGQTVGAYYPKPSHRVPGDIDFYVVREDFSRAVELINSHWGLVLDANTPGMHLEFKLNNIHFEMHRYLLSFPDKRTKHNFEELIDRYPYEPVMVEGKDVPTLTPTVNVFYVFLHLYNHFIKLGVALRQLCDLAVLLHGCRDCIDRGMLLQLLEEYDFKRAFAAFGHILIDKLGLPVDDFPLTIDEKDCRNGERILELVWQHGNWGSYNRDFAKKGTLKYFFDKTYVRLSSQVLFYKLSPKFNKSILLHDLPRKMKMAAKVWLGKHRK